MTLSTLLWGLENLFMVSNQLKKDSLRAAYYFGAFVVNESEVHSYTMIPLLITLHL